MDSCGKMVARKFGIRPITEGPSMIPPTTSATTRGWRILERGQCSKWHMMMIKPAYHDNVSSAQRSRDRETGRPRDRKTGAAIRNRPG